MSYASQRKHLFWIQVPCFQDHSEVAIKLCFIYWPHLMRPSVTTLSKLLTEDSGLDYGVVTAVNRTGLYSWHLLRLEPICSYHTSIHMFIVCHYGYVKRLKYKQCFTYDVYLNKIGENKEMDQALLVVQLISLTIWISSFLPIHSNLVLRNLCIPTLTLKTTL